MNVMSHEKKDLTENYAQVKTLKKSLDLLEYFTIDHPEWSISELSRASGLYKSNVFNILYTFVQCGYVERIDNSDKYRLGKKFLDKSHIVHSNLTNFDLVHRALLELLHSIPEIIYFGILNNFDVMYIDAAVPENRYITKAVIGMTAPAYCTGIGKALLSACKPQIVDELLCQKLEPYTPQTITDPDVLCRELELIRNRGYSIDDREHSNTVKCVAVPVFDRSGNLYGAISTSGPSYRMSDETVANYAELLTYTAKQIQAHL